MRTTLFQRHQRLRLLHIELLHHPHLSIKRQNHILQSLIYICVMPHWASLKPGARLYASWLCFLSCSCRTFTRNFMTKRNESFSHQARPLIPRSSSMRLGKTSNMLFLNDLDSSDVQKMRSNSVFRYHQSRLLRDSMFNNNVISSLSSMTPFLIYA